MGLVLERYVRGSPHSPASTAREEDLRAQHEVSIP